MKFQALNTQSLAKQIATHLRDAILSGELQVDDRLPTEEELASRYAVSRPTVREALKHLAAQNLIRSRRGPTGGTFIKRPSQEELRSSLTTASTLMVSMGEFTLLELAEAREELETTCCRLAAERRTQKHLDDMARELECQRDPQTSDEEFCASDVAFHRALIDASENSVMQFVMFAVIEALQPSANMVIFRFRERDMIIRQHEQLYKAVSERDSNAAEAAFKEQMRYLKTQYAQAQAWREAHDDSDRSYS